MGMSSRGERDVDAPGTFPLAADGVSAAASTAPLLPAVRLGAEHTLWGSWPH